VTSKAGGSENAALARPPAIPSRQATPPPTNGTGVQPVLHGSVPEAIRQVSTGGPGSGAPAAESSPSTSGVPTARVAGARAEDTPHLPRVEVLRQDEPAASSATDTKSNSTPNTVASAAAPAPAAAAGGAVIGGAAAAADTGRAAAGPLNVSSVALTHSIISAPRPVYPPNAKFLGVEGTVVVQAVVGRDGNVKSARALLGPAPLTKSAIDAVRLRRYKPLIVNGQPTEFQTDIVLVYHLRDHN